MAIYTVVGWLLERHRSRVDYFDARSARVAIDSARERMFDRDGAFAPDWRFVIAVPGKRILASRYETIDHTAMRDPASSGGGALEPFTVVGFWRHSMETICVTDRYGGADESVLQVLAQLGQPGEIQMVGAFAGEVPAEMRREGLPPNWDVVAPPRSSGGGRAAGSAVGGSKTNVGAVTARSAKA